MPIVFGRGVVEKIKEVIKFVEVVKSLNPRLPVSISWGGSKRRLGTFVAVISVSATALLRFTFAYIRRSTDSFVLGRMPSKPLLFPESSSVERGEATVCPRTSSSCSYITYPAYLYPSIRYTISVSTEPYIEAEGG